MDYFAAKNNRTMIYFLWVILPYTIKSITTNISTCPNQQWIEESLKKGHVPGAAIVVVNATHILYQQAFGYQSLSPQQPMDVNKSIFPLASISKTFIAAAVMQLVEQELVDLDTDVNIYLSEPNKRIFHPHYPKHSITLRKLLSHSASIYISDLVQYTYFQPNDDAFNESLADMCFKYVNPNTSNWLPKPPGTMTSYSNEGPTLAALVVERVSNMSYIDYVKDKIIKLLDIDINKVGVRLSDFANIEDLVKHYIYATNMSYVSELNHLFPQLNITQIQDDFPSWVYISHFGLSAYPAGLLRMSAGTLSIYLRMFLNNGFPILRPQSIAEIRTVVGGCLIPPYNPEWSNNSTGLPPSEEFGLSWYWQTMKDGRRYIGHSGSLPGMSHLMLVNEKNTLGVILLSNIDIGLTEYPLPEMSGLAENIHMLLFQCFDIDLVDMPASCTERTRIRFFTVLLLLQYFFICLVFITI